MDKENIEQRAKRILKLTSKMYNPPEIIDKYKIITIKEIRDEKN